LHRQRSKLRVRTTAKSRILHRLTASLEQAIQRRRVGTSQIRRDSTRTMQPGRSRDYTLYRHVGGTPVGRPSTNVHRRAPGVLDHARVDEPTRTESCSASPTSWGGPIGVNATHVTPRKIRRYIARLGLKCRAVLHAQIGCYVPAGLERRLPMSPLRLVAMPVYQIGPGPGAGRRCRTNLGCGSRTLATLSGCNDDV
jgi:hypothetical protein